MPSGTSSCALPGERPATVRLAIAAAAFALLPTGLWGQVATTTTLISVTPAAPVFGQKVTLTAMVAPAVTGGFVDFVDGGVLLGTGSVIGGVASASTLTPLSP